MEVRVRKYEVDRERLIECLQSHKRMPNQRIADALGKPKTLVDHWFRKDKYFAIPDEDIWFDLKDLLGIDTEEFDKAIMTFENRGGSYDMSNRIYCGNISPTFTSRSENFMYLVEK